MKKFLLVLAMSFIATYVFLAARQAHAQAPTDADPWAGKCFGDGTSTCLVPELSFDVTRMRLNGPDAGKVEAGAVPIGAGYALLFGYDQWWASGPSVHAIFDLSQLSANSFQVSGAATVARYGHIGVTYERIGGAGAWFGVVGLNVPVDLVTSNMASAKANQVRSARAEKTAQ